MTNGIFDLYLTLYTKEAGQMITFHPEIQREKRRKDGTWQLKIRVTYAGKVRRLPTTITVTQNDLTRGGRIKSPTILSRADELVARMREAVADLSPFSLEGKDVDWVVHHIRRQLGGEDFRLDFFAFADGYLKGKTATTRRTYDQALGALERYLGERRLDVNDITRAMLLEFADVVDGEPKMKWNWKRAEWQATDKEKVAGAASARHLAKLAHIYQAAKDKYNDEDSGVIVIPRSPFASVRRSIPSPTGGQRNLGAELMQRIIDARTDDRRERAALDVFLLSFLLMGANMADLWEAVPPSGGVWTYHRKKTRTRRADGAEMRVTVPSTAAPFVARLGANDECLGGIWLPVLREFGKTKDICTAKVNGMLRRWADREGVPPFTFYAARHTWATLARKAGVEKATVDECLGHVGDFSLTDIYAERSWELMAAANGKVVALFRWE